ncbi:MAG: DUF4381 domain-containing protein [Gammaproteobacteria bacterium]|nr:DUF4381 domain-containing protein [Gammaproteobacteria bacterium]
MNTDELPLRDIHLPAEVSAWPPAIGWYLLAALVLLLIAAGWLWRRWRQRRAVHQLAQQELINIRQAFAQHNNAAQLASDVSTLLRRVCLLYFPREQVAGLQGQAWIDFLNQIHPVFEAELAQFLLTAPYARQIPQFDLPLLDSTELWLKQLQKKNRGPA